MSDTSLVDILRATAPGTLLRDAIDNIVDLGRGGLLLVASENEAEQIVETGFEIRTRITPQRVIELSKMDRAIVVDDKIQTILYANAYLMPDPKVSSDETGTRHMTAEKVAKQLGVTTIAVSASRGRVTIYCGPHRHTLRDIISLNAQANQALRILEQYRATFDDLSREMTALELEGRVLPYHVANLVQTIIQMLTIRKEIESIFVELGEEKELMELQLDWLMQDTEDELKYIVWDMRAGDLRRDDAVEAVRELTHEELPSTEKVMEALGYEAREEDMDETIPSRGYRVLNQIPRIPLSVIERLVDTYGSLKEIRRESEEDLMKIKGIGQVRARTIRLGIQRLERSLMYWEGNA